MNTETLQTAKELINLHDNLRNQNYCCISLLSPTTPNQKFHKRMINIRSPFFKDNDSAIKYAKFLKSRYGDTERDFDIYVVKLGCWIPWNDGLLDETEYSLEDIMLENINECENNKISFENRKNELLQTKETCSNVVDIETNDDGKVDLEKGEFETDDMKRIKDETEYEEDTFGNTKMLLDDKPMDDIKFYLVSFLESRENSLYGFKVSGIFDDESTAVKRIEDIQNYNKYMNVYVGQVGKWLDWNPKSEDCLEQHWGNEKVDNFMRDYEDNQKKIAAVKNK